MTTASTTPAGAAPRTRTDGTPQGAQGRSKPASPPDRFATMVGRLNKLSVEKHFEAYVDVDWDSHDSEIRPDDDRLVVPDFEPITRTEWYRSLSTDDRARYGLYRYAACMKIGWHFENILQRGLLAFVMREPNGSDSFRYVHHEIIEESQHTLMFQEYVNRSGLPVRGMKKIDRFIGELIIEPMAKHAKALFFVFVLGGEEPADHLQKLLLRSGVRHPLLERIMRIHITEEARHISFARHYLMREVPKIGRVRRFLLSMISPAVLGEMARIMGLPPADLRKHMGMPTSVMWSAYRTPEGRTLLADSVSSTRALLVELGLVNPVSKLIWKAYGIWEGSGSSRPKADQSEPENADVAGVAA